MFQDDSEQWFMGKGATSGIRYMVGSLSRGVFKDKWQGLFPQFPAFGCRTLRSLLNYCKGFVNPSITYRMNKCFTYSFFMYIDTVINITLKYN